MRSNSSKWRPLLLIAAGMAIVVAAACGSSEPEIIERTVIVTSEPETIIETVESTVIVNGTPQVITETVVVNATATATPSTFFGIPIPTPSEGSGEAPAPKSPGGTVVIRTGLELRGSGMPGDQEGHFAGNSVTEKPFLTDEAGNAVNQVIDSWVLAPDLTSVTFVVKENVPFHKGYGTLSADDFVWSFNTGNPGFNPVSATDGGASWVSFIGNNPVVAIDDMTVRVPIATFDVRWDTFLFGQSGLALSIMSKQAFDQNGEDWSRDNVIGTGPFEVVEYSRDDVLELSAVKPHHRATPNVDTLIYRSIPDISVAEAALEVGDVDILSGPLNLRNVGQLTADGFITLGAGAGSFHTVSFSGNYWETEHYITGEPLPQAFDQGTLNISPWVGHPNVEGSMERSKLVRKALSYAINRELIAEVLTGGAGWPTYMYGHDINNPNWDPKWNVEYNPELAEQMLDEAGFPRNEDGIRFEMPFFIRLGRGEEDTGQAVVGMWREIGIDVQDWKAQYQTYRPSLVGRTAIAPWVHSAGAEGPQQPWDWPVIGPSECSRGRGGFNIGFEVRELCEFFDRMGAEPDKQARIGIRNEMAEFLFEWNPAIGVIAVPQVAIANPNKIESWDMPFSVREAQVHHPEFLVAK